MIDMKKSFILLFILVTVGFCLAQEPLMPSLWLRADSVGLGTSSWRDVSGNRIVFGLGHPIDDSQANRNVLADGDFIIMGTDSCGMSVTSVLSLADGRTFETVYQSVVQVSGSSPSQYGTYLQVAETPSSASPQNHILKKLVPLRSRLRPNLIPLK